MYFYTVTCKIYFILKEFRFRCLHFCNKYILLKLLNNIIHKINQYIFLCTIFQSYKGLGVGDVEIWFFHKS